MAVWVILALVVVTTGGRGIAQASLGGSASLVYGDYAATAPAGDTSARYFLQQYEVMWKMQGALLGSRAGEYRLGLGYEWNDLSTHWSDEVDRDVRAGKLLYEGYLKIAPGGLPLRLMMYSWDRKRTLLQYDTRHKNNVGVGDNFTNGQRVETGAQLLLGIKNGSYLGNYRDVLSQWPRILLDFKQVYVKDTKSLVPSHFLQRDLAFISLNKKDNWFHYRFSDYRDLSGLPDAKYNDYVNQEYILGTIDQVRSRQWINLTNWIKLSADGSLSVFKTKSSLFPLQTYTLNGFTQMRTARFHVAEYASFEREREGERIAYAASLPVNWEYQPSGGIHWRGNLGLTERKERSNQALLNKDEQRRSARVNLDYRQLPAFGLELELSGEQATRNDGAYWTATFLTRLRSKAHDLRKFDWQAEYRGSHYQNDSGGALTEHTLLLRLSGTSGRWRWGGGESLSLSHGTIKSSDENVRAITSTDLQGNAAERDGTTLKSQTTLYLETRWLGIDDRLELGYGFENAAGKTAQAYSIGHSARADRKSWTFATDNSYHSALARQSYTTGNGPDAITNSEGWQLQNSIALRWLPHRAFTAKLKADHSYMHSASPLSVYRAEEALVLKGNTSNGIVRTLWTLEQTASSEKYRQTGQVQSFFHLNKVGIAGNYYPTSHLETGVQLRYEWKEKDDDALWYLFSHVTMRYQLLSASLNYSRSYSVASDTTEQRWEALVRKSF